MVSLKQLPERLTPAGSRSSAVMGASDPSPWISDHSGTTSLFSRDLSVLWVASVKVVYEAERVILA